MVARSRDNRRDKGSRLLESTKGAQSRPVGHLI